MSRKTAYGGDEPGDDPGGADLSERSAAGTRTILEWRAKVFRVIDTYIDIDAPPEHVWTVLVDLPAWKEWNPFIPFITGKLEPGARLHIIVSPPGIKPMEFKPKAFAVRPGGNPLGRQLLARRFSR